MKSFFYSFAKSVAAFSLIFLLWVLFKNTANLKALKLQNIALQDKISQIEGQLAQNRYVYVYDLERLVAEYPDLMNKQKEYADKIESLTKQTIEAREKIEKLKNADLKEDFSDIYINSLVLKRDDLLSEYNGVMNEVTANINNSLAKIAKERNIKTVFPAKFVVVRSEYVIDITDEILEDIKQLYIK